MKLLSPIIAACCSFFALAAVSAQNIPPDQNLTANPIFQKNCAKCHGKTANGRHFGGPSLVSEKATSMPLEDLRNFITNGKGRMPKFSGKLTEAEIDTLVRQIRAGNKR